MTKANLRIWSSRLTPLQPDRYPLVYAQAGGKSLSPPSVRPAPCFRVPINFSKFGPGKKHAMFSHSLTHTYPRKLRPC